MTVSVREVVPASTTIFGNTTIAAELVDVTSARATPAHTNSPPRTAHTPERKEFHFTVRIALLLSAIRENPAIVFPLLRLRYRLTLAARRSDLAGSPCQRHTKPTVLPR